MKRIILLILLIIPLLFGIASGATEWLVCDPPLENIDTDLDNDVVEYMVKVGSAPFVSVAYNANGQGYQKLWNVTGMTTETFQMYAVNAQGRISEVVTYDLAAPPTGCENIRTVVE